MAGRVGRRCCLVCGCIEGLHNGQVSGCGVGGMCNLGGGVFEGLEHAKVREGGGGYVDYLGRPDV